MECIFYLYHCLAPCREKPMKPQAVISHGKFLSTRVTVQ